MRNPLFLVLLLFLAGSPVLAQLDLGANDPWAASWIWRDGQADNMWVSFRKTVDLPTTPGTVTARIAADSKYWLWINGILVVREGGLKRGPTPQDTFYDQVDLTGYLREGRNVIAALVWYWGKDGHAHKDSGAGGFLFEADAAGTRIKTDRTWRALRNPAYGSTDAPVPNHRLSEHNVRFDAAQEVIGWYTPGYNDTGWSQARELGIPPVAPWHRMYRRFIPQWKDYGLTPYLNNGTWPQVSDGTVIVGQLPYNAHVHPYLKIRSPQAGLLIDIRTDHYAVNNIDGTTTIPTVRAELRTRVGEQEFEVPAWINGHKVEYRMPAGIEILELGYRETGYATDFTGHFETSDPFLNTLWEKARRTAYVCMRDGVMDGPDRERAPAIGDGVVAMSAMYYAFDPSAHLLARKQFIDLVNWQRADHILYAPVPSGNWENELPMQVLAGIGPYGLWNYYMHTGDLETISLVYPAIRQYLDVWQIGADGLVVQREGGWAWYDWGINIHEDVLDNGWYFLALKAAVEMARLTGHDADVPDYEARMQSIAQNFNPVFWDRDGYRAPNQGRPKDDRANAIAVLAGMVDAGKAPAVNGLLRREQNAGLYMENYVLEAMFQLGDMEGALARMRTRYQEMVESDITTLWEFWERDKMTLNHAFGTGVLRVLTEHIGGIAPDTPAFETYHVRPQPQGPDQLNLTVPTVKGPIHYTYTFDGSFEADEQGRPHSILTLDSPGQTTATVSLPKHTRHTQHIVLNGTTIWESGASLDLPIGATFLEEDDTYYHYRLAPGRWRFEMYLIPSPAHFTDLSLSVKGNEAWLSWQTDRQVNNTGFEVEEQVNGSFQSVGFVQGAGNSADVVDYRFALGRVSAGEHVYRVRAIATDGSFGVSPVARLVVPYAGAYALTPAFPNPTGVQSTIGLTVAEAQRVKIDLMDLLGRSVAFVFDGHLEAGTQYRFNVSVQGLPSGVYLYRVAGVNFATLGRLIVAN